MATQVASLDRQTYSIKTTARLLGCSIPLAYQLAKENRLPVPVIRLGDRRMVVSKVALDDVLNQRKPAGDGQAA